MFDIFRKHTRIMMMVMFLLIIPSFVLLGIDGYSSMNETDVPVARVGRTDITQAQWDAVLAGMRDAFRAGRYEAGLAQAIATVDALLLLHFPLQAGQRNPDELPNRADLR